MPIKTDIQAAINADEVLMEKYHNRLTRMAYLRKRAIARNVQAALAGLVADKDGVIRGDPRNIAVARAAAESIAMELTGAGFTDLERDIIKVFEARVATIDRLAKALGVEAAVLGMRLDELPTIERRVGAFSDRIGRGNEELATRAFQAVGRYVTQMGDGQPISLRDMKEELVTRAGVSADYVHTIAQTELAAIERDLRKLQGERAGITMYRYVGPVDQRTREFCLYHVGVVESMAYWESIDNGVGPNPPSIYGGGYNCRHRLLFWREDWGAEEGGPEE